MNKNQNSNAEMQHNEEFDRSVCMSFFGNYRTSIKRIEKRYGKEMAYDVQSAIIDYGLYKIRPDDEDLLIFISETVFDVIDKGQAKRARAFSGEDLEMSKKIIQSHRDRPDLSQEKLAKLLGTSKGKVNKTLKKYRNGEYDGIIIFDQIIDYDYDNAIDYDNDYDSTDRDRDRPTDQSTESASPSAAPSDPAPTQQTELNWEEYTSVIDMWEKNKTRDKTERKSPNNIAEELNLNKELVNNAITEYMDNGYKRKDEPKPVPDIPLMNGEYLCWSKQQLFDRVKDNDDKTVEEIDWGCIEESYTSMGVAPFLAKSLIKEFKQRLQGIQDMRVLQRAVKVN